MTDFQKEITASRKRIESWSRLLTQQLTSEIDRFSAYVKDQCDLHKLRIFEELDSLQHRLEDQPTATTTTAGTGIDIDRSSSSYANVKLESREGVETPKKRIRQATKIYSPESQKNSTKGRHKSSSSSSHVGPSPHSSTRSLRKKSRVSYTYSSESEISNEEPEQETSLTSKSSDNFHQLLSSNICSHLVSSPLAISSPPAVLLPLPPPSLHPPPAPQLSQLRAPPLELLEIYQSHIMKLLTTPTPQKYQFRHYQDIYYLWGGYYQTRPYAMSYKLLTDLLHFFSDQNNYDGKSNTRYMRQAIYNLLRSGDLVLLDSSDESSVFISLDDDKECISSKHMIALPLSPTLVRKHLKDDQVVITELAQLFCDIYYELLSSSERTAEKMSQCRVSLGDLQREFISSVQSGKCKALSERYPENEGAEEKIPWEYYLPPNEHWRRYRRYEMVDIASFYKYLEAEKLIIVTKTSKSEFIQWIGEEEEDEEEDTEKSEGQQKSLQNFL